MEGDHIKIHTSLIPLSWLYGIGVGIRNWMFDIGLLHSHSFKTPVICIGNITVGGTGKTPHTEYLIRLLSDTHQVAVLSRGYKRKTKGYQLATSESKMSDIGDEPYQMKKKFPDIHMAVDSDRCHGITELTKQDCTSSNTEVILLDDAYQHRYVHPGMNILLMDYHRLIYFDKLLPAGRLREHKSGKKRADIVIITKCPRYITPMDQRGIERNLNLDNWQQIYFSTFEYGKPKSLFGRGESTLQQLSKKGILLLTGIASPKQMIYDLQKIIPEFDTLSFPDHHNFTDSDIASIREKAKGKMVITTEKDASRLADIGADKLGKSLAESIYVLPIEVQFMNGKQSQFDKTIMDFVNGCSKNV